MRSILRILAGMLLGVLIAWLVHDTPISEDERALLKSTVQVHVQGNVSSEQVRLFRQQAEAAALQDYIKKKPKEFNAYMFTEMAFWATIFGMLAANSLLFDLTKTGFLRRRQTEAVSHEAK